MAASKPNRDTATSKNKASQRRARAPQASKRSPQARRHAAAETPDPNPAQIKTLSLELERVQGELRHLKAAMFSEVKTDIDEGDVEVSERIKNVSLIAMLEQREQTLQDAIKSVEMGQYGLCNRCQTPINPERLEALPDAKYCIRCQDEIERLTRTV